LALLVGRDNSRLLAELNEVARVPGTGWENGGMGPVPARSIVFHDSPPFSRAA
jgi:hypothetical protein